MKYHVAPKGDVFNVRVIAANPEGVFDDVSAAALERRQFPAAVHPLRNCSHVVVYRDREDYAAASRHSSP